MSDEVNHPKHYNQGGVECIEALESIGLAEDYCRGNAIKYLWRLKDKGAPLKDARKAAWYVNRLVSILEAEAEKQDEAERERVVAVVEQLGAIYEVK